ncbi:MAG: ribonuclease P protein component [Flammeovirgaceae bacterium]|jgi:ribonuclease P protein component
MPTKFTFPKSEKLTHKKDIEALFRGKEAVFVYPFKIPFQPNSTELETEPNDIKNPKTLISVPKKNFKKAVDRNRIKRQIREIYRLEKSNWLESLPNPPANLAIIFVGKQMEEFAFMEKRLKKALRKLAESLK